MNPTPTHPTDRPSRLRSWLRSLHTDERGEGVISAAIAVLIMAFLGAAMWVGFNTIWDDAEQDISEQVDRIGDDAPAPAPVDDGE